MDACIQYGWPVMKVEPLDNSQMEQIITDYLSVIGNGCMYPVWLAQYEGLAPRHQSEGADNH